MLARSPSIGLLVAAATIATAAAGAEELPRPGVDYAADGIFADGGTMQVRHRAGFLRVDIRMPGSPMPMVGYFDMAAGSAKIVIESRDGPVAIEASVADQAGFGFASGRGARVGIGRVAGEACDLWRMEPEAGAPPLVACIGADGVALGLTAETADGPREIFSLSNVRREAQDEALFRAPDVPTIRLPRLPPPGR